MVKWRIERGVVQQTESLVRGFYEVYILGFFWNLCYTQVGQSSEDMRICGCIPGGGCQVGVGI